MKGIALAILFCVGLVAAFAAAEKHEEEVETNDQDQVAYRQSKWNYWRKRCEPCWKKTMGKLAGEMMMPSASKQACASKQRAMPEGKKRCGQQKEGDAPLEREKVEGEDDDALQEEQEIEDDLGIAADPQRFGGLGWGGGRGGWYGGRGGWYGGRGGWWGGRGGWYGGRRGWWGGRRGWWGGRRGWWGGRRGWWGGRGGWF